MWWNVIDDASLVQWFKFQLSILVLFVFIHGTERSYPVTFNALNLTQSMTSQRTYFPWKTNFADLPELMKLWAFFDLFALFLLIWTFVRIR